MNTTALNDVSGTVLVVDDNPTNLAVVANYLKDYNFKTPVSANGESAVKRAKLVKPDLILLDVMMSGFDGFETCRRLKADDETRDIPVIFMTALADGDSKVKGLTAGAVDYVTKPIHQEEVLARIRTHLQIRNLTRNLQEQAAELADANGQLSQANQEIRRLNDQLTEENLQMHAEMEVARRIQTSMLPDLNGNVHPDFDCAAVMQPCTEVGGDYYDVLFDKTGNLWLAIGDVSGHGVTPGLIMMMAQTIHATLATHLNLEPKEMINMLNVSLFQNVTRRLKTDHFMTFTTLKYKGAGRFDFAGAHLSLIVHRAATKTCDRIETRGVFLNFIPDIAHATQQSSLTLDAGDTLVLYTDGLTEAHTAGGEVLDIERFMAIITRHAGKDPAAMRDAVMDDVLDYSHGVRKDDMTLLLVRRQA